MIIKDDKRLKLLKELEDSRDLTMSYYQRLFTEIERQGTLDSDVVEKERYFLMESISDSFKNLLKIIND